MLQVLASVFTIAAMLAVIAFFFWTLATPEQAHRWNSPNNEVPWWHWPLGFLVYAGFYILIFGGVKSLLWWMPRDWGSADEDGNWTSIAHYVAGLTAVFGAFGAIGFLLRVARERLITKRFENTEKMLAEVERTPDPASLDEITKTAIKTHDLDLPSEKAMVLIRVLSRAAKHVDTLEARVNKLEGELKTSAEHSKRAQDFREHLYARLGTLTAKKEPSAGVADQFVRTMKAAGLDPIDSEVKLSQVLSEHFRNDGLEVLEKLKMAAGPYIGDGGALCCLAFKDVPRDLTVGHFQFDVGIGLASMEDLRAPLNFNFIHSGKHTVMVD